MGEAVIRIARLDDAAVVRDAIKQGSRHLGVIEYRHPLAELKVGRDDDTGGFIQFADQMKQQRPAGFWKRNIAKLVDDHAIQRCQLLDDLSGVSLSLLRDQGIDQIDGVIGDRSIVWRAILIGPWEASTFDVKWREPLFAFEGTRLAELDATASLALMNQGFVGWGDITVISDGEECLKRLAGMLPQPATHILDWFHISMKLQPLAQMALTAPQGYGLFEQDIDRIKWRLWNGQSRRALDLIALVRKPLSSKTGHCLWARRADKLLEKLNTYSSRNGRSVINYGERHQAGQRLATSPTEASVNSLVAKRFVKKQQMRWSRTGAQYLLKVRAAILNGDLSERTRYDPPETEGSPYVASLLNPTPPLLKAA